MRWCDLWSGAAAGEQEEAEEDQAHGDAERELEEAAANADKEMGNDALAALLTGLRD